MSSGKTGKGRRYAVQSDGITVWVNDEIAMIGRFGKMGIDIHRQLDEQCEKGECLYCTHEPTTETDWPVFVQKMRELHGVNVSERYKPKRLR